jgi:Tol biopolymer transport system component
VAWAAAVDISPLLKIAFDPDAGTVIGEPLDVWRGSRTAIYPNISPDGEWIAFSFQIGGGKASLALIRPDGTDLRDLTDASTGNIVVQWSPDGEEISFTSNRSGSFEVWSIHRDGSGLRQITNTPEHFTSGGYWSPDGSLMAIFSDKRYFLMDPRKPWKEQTPQPLPTRDVEGYLEISEFSPDGRRLAGYWEGGEDAYRLTLYDLDTKKYRIFEAEGRFPTWLADGRRLLYSASNNMYLLDTITGEVRNILSDVEVEFSVSPDNRWIYFSRSVREADIWMVTLNQEHE